MRISPVENGSMFDVQSSVFRAELDADGGIFDLED
jgi:hypothetical protein